MKTEGAWVAAEEQRRKQATFSFRVLAFALLTVAGVLVVLGTGDAWLVALIGVGVSTLLVWGALRGDSILAPIAVLLATCVVAVAVSDGLALTQVVAAVVALALGETLSAHRRIMDSSVVTATGADAQRGIAVVGLVAAGAATGAVAISFLPQWRFWSLAAVGAAVVLMTAVDSRRRSLPQAGLPPPPAPLSGPAHHR